MDEGNLSREEQHIFDNAVIYANKNKKAIAKRLADKSIYVSEEEPVSVLMAGSPGAGKTEASKALLGSKNIQAQKILRIDPDELRSQFPSYTGENSFLFQGAVSILVDRIHDEALKNLQSFILDGTLSNYSKARENIGRSLKRKRFVQILYVYQEPLLAWDFVRKREIVEGRKILPAHFIEQYFQARNNVDRLKRRFGSDLQIDLLWKHYDGSNRVYKANIDKIDNHVPEKYTRTLLEEIIRLDYD